MRPKVSDRITTQIEAMSLSRTPQYPTYAYCFLLYGANPSAQIVANALAVARSLENSIHLRVILLSEDVPAEVDLMLTSSGYFHEIHRIPYIFGVSALFKKKWFLEVFTKLHIFNLVQFHKVIFLDLDMVVRDVRLMDDLFHSSFRFGAMENSKHARAGSMWLNHGDTMGKHCKLINAGLIMVTPDADLFKILLEDVTHESLEHVPGMTPEQFYLARVMGEHFHHISQRFNFETQLHGGVPRSGHWEKLLFSDIVCFHFSGGHPLRRIREVDNCDWGCQTEKHMIFTQWLNDLKKEQTQLANERARLAFGLWALNFATACKTVRTKMISDFPTDSSFYSLVYYGHNGEAGISPGEPNIGDETSQGTIVVRNEKEGLLTVNPTTYELKFVARQRPMRAAPALPHSANRSY
jgi:hypothetical protein